MTVTEPDITAHATLSLRPYQDNAMTKVIAAWYSNVQRPAVVLPTGTGKTVIFAHLAADWIEHRGQGSRVVILVHRDELADQALAKLHQTDPSLRLGKVKAADDETGAQVMVCSVQTLAREARLNRLLASRTYAGPVGMVIVDEAHHAAAPTYKKIMEELGCFRLDEQEPNGQRPGTRAVGFTATMARGDGVGLGGVWEEIVAAETVLKMIAEGYLVDVRGKDVDLDIDLGSVKTSGGDYQAKSLGDAIMAADGPKKIAAGILKFAADRRPIVFTPDVATAHETAAELEALGIPSGVVDGKTSREDRQLIYKKYRLGEIQCLVNCMVLTEGADFPWADCAVIARPTKSEPLYIQMVGRVLRPYPGKEDALVLNMIGAGGTLRTLIDLDPGLVTPALPGESLTEAYVRQETRAETRVSADNLLFALKHRDLDLFGSSAHVWLRTRGGVLFLPMKAGEVFLWPDEDDTWLVAWAPPGNRPWKRLHRRLPLGLAQAWAETEASGTIFSLSAASARWRKETADVRTVTRARSMGITVPPGSTRGWVSDQISTVLAGQKFDERMKTAIKEK